MKQFSVLALTLSLLGACATPPSPLRACTATVTDEAVEFTIPFDAKTWGQPVSLAIGDRENRVLGFRLRRSNQAFWDVSLHPSKYRTALQGKRSRSLKNDLGRLEGWLEQKDERNGSYDQFAIDQLRVDEQTIVFRNRNILLKYVTQHRPEFVTIYVTTEQFGAKAHTIRIQYDDDPDPKAPAPKEKGPPP